MSRPKGPPHYPNMPAEPTASHPSQTGRSQGYEHGYEQAGHHASHGRQPMPSSDPYRHPGHAPQGYGTHQSLDHGQPRYPEPTQYGQEASSHAQSPQAGPHGGAPQSTTPYGGESSWADLNQPLSHGTPSSSYGERQYEQAPHPSGYGEPAGYGRQPNAPSYGYDHTTGHPGNHTAQQQPAPVMPDTTPAAAPAGYDFASFETPQPAAPGAFGSGGGAESQVDWGYGAQSAHAAGEPSDGSNFGLAQAAPGLESQQVPAEIADAYTGDDEDYEFDESESSGRGRFMVIVGALAGAIVAGGSLAYGYQAIFGPSDVDGPPVVKQATGPAKVKPADPGGRKFSHTDSKIMDRLGSASGKTNDPSGGARRVSTLRIGPDGAVIPPANPTAARAGPRMVTGMALGGPSTVTTPAGAANANTQAPQKPIVVNPPSDNKPVKVAKVEPVTTSTAAPAVTTKAVAPPSPKPSSLAKPKTKPTKVAVAKPQPTSTGPKPTGAGYVAVLASVPASDSSRMDALKQFADMQQQYGAALQNKTPDVQKADLGAKGTYHRLIAGPPGSAQSARAVCDQLKASGYPSCWVLAY